MATEYVFMGTITRPHGIKGEICVDWHADSPELLRGTFFLQRGNEAHQKVEGARTRMHKGRPLLTLPFVNDRNGAEALRGTSIFVERSDLPELSDEEMYLHDILEFDIINQHSGQSIGILEGVQFPSEEQMLWVIRAHGGQEILFPAVEEFIVSFDEEARSVVINPPEGLLELYLEQDSVPSKKSTQKK